MSAIRSDLPAAIPHPIGDASAARNAQAAFFRAALTQAQTPQAPTASVRGLVQPQGASPSAGDPNRAVRPGSLLDIRV